MPRHSRMHRFFPVAYVLVYYSPFQSVSRRFTPTSLESKSDKSLIRD